MFCMFCIFLQEEDVPETDRSGSQRALSQFGSSNRRNFREPPKRLNRNRINSPATESSANSLRRNTPGANPELEKILK